MTDPIFHQEQEHLTKTYSELCRMESGLTARMKEMLEKVPEEKKDIRENLSLNFGSDTDTMETYIEFEVMNHVIDQYNIEQDSLDEKLRRVRQLKKAPYFARIQLQFEPDEEPEDYYIGSAAVSENGYDHLVIDWRSPIAETYYNQESGKTSYEVDGRRIETNLTLRRQFDLVQDQLRAYFDTQIAIEDPMLIGALSRSRSDKMQAITVTIQKEQNAVIRYPDVPALLVNGIAGSGKTSVLLQRIAYLFYRQRKNLKPQDVWLVTLNPVFRTYIDSVLPDMGEMNPNTLTWQEFLEMVGAPRRGSADAAYRKSLGRENSEAAVTSEKAFKQQAPAEEIFNNEDLNNEDFNSENFNNEDSEEAILRRIDRELPSLKLLPSDFLPVWQKKTKVLTPSQISKVLSRYDQIPTGVRLIQVAIDDLKEAAKAAIRRMERDNEENGRSVTDSDAGGFSGGSYPGSNSYTQAGEGPSSPRSAAGEDNRIQAQYGGAFQAIGRCSWLNIDAVFTRMFGRRPNALEWFYLKMALTGECERSARYVCIDEVQDYTAAQLMVLRRYFINAKFMLLGDEFQAIRPGTVTFAQIHELFSGENNFLVKPKKDTVVELPLMTSYRSTPEITALFTSLLPDLRRVQIHSVQHEGMQPEMITCKDRREYARRLTDAVQSSADADAVQPSEDGGAVQPSEDRGAPDSEMPGLTAVICHDARSLDRVRSILTDQGRSIPVVRQNDSLPASGICIMELAMSKGLEFDRVIIPDADTLNYPDTLLSRHQLYTAISRATRQLVILSANEMTSLLRQG